MPWNTFTGKMARRLLVNWRVPLEVVASILPRGEHNLRPTAVDGVAIAGLCLVRLEHLRPAGIPRMLGLASENLAVRIGVEWDSASGTQRAVLILRRETASRVNTVMAPLAGFGVHHRCVFRVSESATHAGLAVHSDDGNQAHVNVTRAAFPMTGSAFRSVSQAQAFFHGGECGYSPGNNPGIWHGAKLHMHRWDLECMDVSSAHSSIIDGLFGTSAVVDSAFIMRDIEHTWTVCSPEKFGALRMAHVSGAAIAMAA